MIEPSSRIRRRPPGEPIHEGDDEMARSGRSKNKGERISPHRFIQPAPMFFTQDLHPLWIGDLYRGRSAFLIASGPSFTRLDHSKLRQPGVLTVGLNNSVKTFRPNLWVSVDRPDRFLRSIWLDPTIMKFVPICQTRKLIFNSDRWEYTNLRAGDCPNTVFYKRNGRFQARQFLWEDSINWGNSKDFSGGRSVMFATIRILYILGIRRVYLLGVDFLMNDAQKYHFEQERTKAAISQNNSTYVKMEKRLRALRPYLEKEDFHVYNCNQLSNLKAFDFISYEDALRNVQAEFDNIDVDQERTVGLYDTPPVEKKKGIR